MFVYAGIDESGYGPIFGPLVVARSVFTMETDCHPALFPDSLWGYLVDSVCRRVSDDKDLIPVNDSKLLYSAAIGLRHLERGVLPFIKSLYHLPAAAGELIKLLAFDDESVRSPFPWYADTEDGPVIPSAGDSEQIRLLTENLLVNGEKQCIRIADLSGAVVFEDRFNRLLEKYPTKAACSWSFVQGHLSYIWNTYGEHHPFVVIDRQGGRKFYESLFAGMFPDTIVGVTETGDNHSAYRIIGKNRSMDIVLKIQSEQYHLPAALASMTAKYLRELFMTRFQRYWSRIAPDIRPTFGYFKDGKRFLAEIEPYITSLGIRRETLIRRK